MQATAPIPDKARFGPFEVDAAAGALRKHGLRIKLQKQPLQILLALIEKPTQAVTREELRQRIWGDDTVVDFEHGLNAAVNKLRQALSDSSDKPRYIETIPAVGYRLLVPVETIAPVADQERPRAEQQHRRRSLAWRRIGVPLGMLVAGLLAGWWIRPTPVPAGNAGRLTQFTIPLPEGFWSELAGTRQDFAVSPDGLHLAFVASDASKSQLWLRTFSDLATRPIAPDRNVRGLVWAPDSGSLYFDERNTVRQITIPGEVAQTIAELPLRAPWMGLLRSGADLILYTRAGTFSIPASGGTPTRMDDAAFRWTQALPGNYLLNVRYESASGRYRAWASNLRDRNDQRALVEADSRVMFAARSPGDSNGHVLFLRSGTLVAQSFNARTLQLAGNPQAVVENVFSFQPTGAAAFSASETGVLVYRTVRGASRLKWVDRSGRELATIGKPAPFMTPFRLSPDGRRLAATVYEVEKGGMSVWIYDAQDGTARRLTTGRETEAMAVWSPDGTRVAFGRAAGSTPKLYSRNAESAAPGEALPEAPFQLPTDWSRDGRFILYQTTGGAGEPGADVVAADLSRPGTIVPLLHSDAQEFEATFSPDGSAMAFICDETGPPELYVQDFSAGPEPRLTGQKRQVSHGGASIVRWRADASEIYYIDSENWITATALDRMKVPGATRRLFRVDFPPRQLTAAGPAVGFDVTGDGQRFLLPDTTKLSPSPFVVVQNWTELLRRNPE